jgi:hypothetical protein
MSNRKQLRYTEQVRQFVELLDEWERRNPQAIAKLIERAEVVRALVEQESATIH